MEEVGFEQYFKGWKQILDEQMNYNDGSQGVKEDIVRKNEKGLDWRGKFLRRKYFRIGMLGWSEIVEGFECRLKRLFRLR